MSSEKGKQMTELCERASYMFHGGWYAVKLAESGLVKRQTGPALPLLFVLSNIIVTVVGIVTKLLKWQIHLELEAKQQMKPSPLYKNNWR